MSDFVTDIDSWMRARRRQIAADLTLFALLAAAMLSSWAEWLPVWLRTIIPVLSGGFVLYNIYDYPKIRRDVSMAGLSVGEGGLVHVFRGKRINVPYEDLSLGKVKRRGGKVVSIRINSRFGNRMNLKNFKNMDALYEELKHHLT